MKGKWWLLVLLVITACTPTGNTDADEHEDFDDLEMQDSTAPTTTVLFVSPDDVKKQRAEFLTAFKALKRRSEARPLYEAYIDSIGANGILDMLEKANPKCHSEAHELGKVIFAKLKDIGQSLAVCANRCYSGCMHGVLMEAFANELKRNDPTGELHVNLDELKPLINELCLQQKEMVSGYSPGDCGDGVGHAFMFLADYDIPKAVAACANFESKHLEYYCATGAYMEYITEHDSQDAKTKSMFYPCDEAAYPAACFRYKFVHVLKRHFAAKKSFEDSTKFCEEFAGKVRLGCVHGLGNGFMYSIYAGKVMFKAVCERWNAEEQFVCIEGVMERMAKYVPERARKVCDQLDGKNKETCLNAFNNQMYSMEKDLTLYLAE